MKNRMIILAALFLMGCSKPETCDLFIFASHSTEEGVHVVSNRFKLGTDATPEACEKEAKRRRDKMKGVYLWYGHEVPYEELVYCECKN